MYTCIIVFKKLRYSNEYVKIKSLGYMLFGLLLGFPHRVSM
jgi:hypothetical protein